MSSPALAGLVIVFTVAVGADDRVASEDVPACPREAESTASRDELRSLVASQHAFALDVHRHLRRSSENLVVSPLSLHVALAMAHAGARGETARELEEVLHCKLTRERATAAVSRLLRDLDETPAKREHSLYEIRMANALWGAPRLELREAFRHLLSDCFGAPLARLDFRESELARNTINAWSSERTGGRIKELVPRGAIKAETALVLANALHFRSRWHRTFSAEQTVVERFHSTEPSSIEVSFLRRSETLPYFEADAFQVVEIPFHGERCSFLLFLPRAQGGLRALEDSLTRELFAECLAGLRPRSMELWLPRFHVDHAHRMKEALAALGAASVFQPDVADFSGIAAGTALAIDEIHHRASLEINEEGAEGSAATAIVLFYGEHLDRSEPVLVRADHPFLFGVRHRATDALLFLGRVAAPDSAN